MSAQEGVLTCLLPKCRGTRVSMNSYGHRTVHSSSSPSLYVYFFSRQVLRPRRMGIVGALSDIFNIGCLEISAEYDPLLVIFGCIFLLKCIPSTIWLRFIARKLISSALKQCIWSKLIEICWLLSSEIQASGGTHIESTIRNIRVHYNCQLPTASPFICFT